MKTSFSTLACPTNSFTDITVMAKDLGFDGDVGEAVCGAGEC